MKIGNIYSNFKLIEKQFVNEENSEALIFEHINTKAKLLKLVNEDHNKTFGIGFRTPPNDSTGVAHILEHTVLNGSEKYRTREPFMDLLKSSLQTFLNAMTFSDKTIYPVASRNTKDFHNLMDVYLDAVFNPRIYDTKEIFMQEGWHYELNSPDENISYKGVVYNEMKGAMSAPEDQVMEKIMKGLYPNTIYKYNSGGDPYRIPKLKYEEFLDFHRSYYHPSNSYIFLYGNGNTEDELEHIAQYIDNYDYLKVDSDIKMQEAFEEPKDKQAYYSLSKDEDYLDKSYIAYSCCTGKTVNVEDVLMNEILNEMFIESQASPIRKALIENEVCEDVLSSYSDGIHQTFSIIAKNAEPEKKFYFDNLVRGIFQDIVENGVDESLLRASVNKIEFSLREKHDHSARGVLSFITAFNTWLYDKSPLDGLKYEEILEELKVKLYNGYFEEYLSERVLNNPHKILLLVKPEPGLNERLDIEVDRRLQSYKEELNDEEIEELIEENKRLSEFQTRIDSEEDKATIPKLNLKDIDTKIERIELNEEEFMGAKLLHLDEFTNSVNYMRFVFDAKSVSYEELPYLSLLSALLGNVDTENYDYSTLSNEVYMNAGDITTFANLYTDFNTGELYPKFVLFAKCMNDKMAKTVDLINEISFKSILDDKKRLKEILLETKSKIEMSVYDSGNVVAMNRMMSYFQQSAYYNEQSKGLEYYFFIQDLDSDYEIMYGEIVQKLEALYKKIFNRNNLLIHLTMESEAYEDAKKYLPSFIEKLNEEEYPEADFSIERTQKNEGILSSSNVQYVSKGFNLNEYGIKYEGSMEVVANIVNMDFLHNQIRAIGGAYGAGIKFYRNGAVATFSYRDPNLKNTVDVYDGIGSYLSSLEISKDDIESSIIGSMSCFDPLLTTRLKASLSLNRYINKVDYKDLDELLNQALSTDLEKIKQLSEPLTKAMKENYLCVLGNENVINDNKDMFNNIIRLKHQYTEWF